MGYLAIASTAHAAEKTTFEDHVQPIFRQHCAVCHSQDDASSDLALDTYAAALAGGAGGAAIVSGDPGASRLWRLITHEEQPAMPPGGDKIPDAELAVVRAWIEGGLLENADSKPQPMRKSAVAAVQVESLGKPAGEPVMPASWYRQPVQTAHASGPVSVLAASPWAPVFAVGWQRQVAVFNADSCELLGIAPYLEGQVQSARFSRDGSLLLVGGGRHAAAGNAALFDVATGARLATVGDEFDVVLAADLSADNQSVALGGPKKIVRVHRVADGKVAFKITKHTDWITAVAFSPNGKLLVTGDRSGGVWLWDAAEGNERGDLAGHTAAITAIDWRADSMMAATTAADGQLILWEAGGKQIKKVNAHPGGAECVRFLRDGRLVTTGRDRQVKLWKPDGAAEKTLGATNDIALAVAITHDDARVIASDFSGELRVIDIASGETVGSIKPNPPTLEERIASAASQKSTAEIAVAQAQQQVELASQALASAKAQVEQHRQLTEKLQSELKRVGAEIDALKHQRENPPSDLAVSKQAEPDDAQEGEESPGSDAEEDPLAASLAALEKEASELGARLGELAKQEQGLPKLEELSQSVTNAEKTLAEKQDALKSAETGLAALQAELEKYAAAGGVLDQETSHRQEEYQKIEQKAAALAESRQAADAKVNEEKRKVDALIAQIEALQQQLTQAKSSMTAAGSQADELERQANELNQSLQSARRAAQVAAAQLRDLTAVQEFHNQREKTPDGGADH